MNMFMEQLVESIKRNGVMTPATVRLKEDGRYELIGRLRGKLNEPAKKPKFIKTVWGIGYEIE